MGKRRKQRREEKKTPKQKGSWLVAPVALLIAGVLGWGWLGSKSSSRVSDRALTESSGYVRRETRTPLSPALFVGQTARTYQIAHEIPEVLDRLYCYCECDKHMGHRSLLSCFVDSHAAT